MADNLTIDSRLNNYNFRLKQHTLYEVHGLVYIFFSYMRSRAFRWSVILGLGVPTYSVTIYLVTTYLVTTYLLLHSCPMDNNRHIVEVARAMMNEKNLPKWYWEEAVNTAVYLMNRCPTSGVHNVTPHEKFFGKKSDLSHVGIFGSIAYVHIPDAT